MSYWSVWDNQMCQWLNIGTNSTTRNETMEKVKDFILDGVTEPSVLETQSDDNLAKALDFYYDLSVKQHDKKLTTEFNTFSNRLNKGTEDTELRK